MDPQTIILSLEGKVSLNWQGYSSRFSQELPVMKRAKLDAEARVVATIYAAEILVFAIGVWRYAL
jgi:hypothetical protein